MTTRLPLPEGYAVAQLDNKRWYPLIASRFYDAQSPDGLLTLIPFFDEEQIISFASRREALLECQQRAQREARYQLAEWRHLAVEADVYPERYEHYYDVIKTITGYDPMVNRWYSSITVYVPGYFCVCQQYHRSVGVSDAYTLEDALQTVAEAVYASYQACVCSQQSTTPPPSSHGIVELVGEQSA